MSSNVKEVWTPKAMSASGTLCKVNQSSKVGGFLAATAGTLEITEGEEAGGATLVPSTPVTAGSYTPLPFHFPNGAYAVLGGGATGTFAA